MIYYNYNHQFQRRGEVIMVKKAVKKKKIATVTKKIKAKKAVLKAVTKPAVVVKGKPIGKITHFYDQISVAVVALNASLKVGDKIKIGKQDQFFEQEVKSMQMDHKPLQVAKKGQEIGLKVKKEVHQNALVYKA